jgi:hypothetical protein
VDRGSRADHGQQREDERRRGRALHHESSLSGR